MNKLLYLPSLPTPFEPGLVGIYYGAVITLTNVEFRHLSRNVILLNMAVNGILYGLLEFFLDRIWLLMLLHLVYVLYQRSEGNRVMAPVLHVGLSDRNEKSSSDEEDISDEDDSSSSEDDPPPPPPELEEHEQEDQAEGFEIVGDNLQLPGDYSGTQISGSTGLSGLNLPGDYSETQIG